MEGTMDGSLSLRVENLGNFEEEIFKVGMCLPAGPYVTDDDVRYIVERR